MRQAEKADWQDYRQHRILEYRKTIYVPAWDEITQKLLSAYWRERGFVFHPPKENENEQVGRRGSAWANMTSFDMSKLMAKLTIIRLGETEITFVLEIDAYMQIISPWEEAYWRLEMERAATFILYGDNQERQWRDFCKRLLPAQWRTTGDLYLPNLVKPPVPPPVDLEGRFISS